MTRTIEAIERHMIPQSKAVSVQSRAARLVAEWQRGPETLSGHAVRKLRLAFATSQSVITRDCGRLSGAMRAATFPRHHDA
jgi:hypothetical protein